MKRLVYGALFLALVGIVFVGCKKSSIPSDGSDLMLKNRNNSLELSSHYVTYLPKVHNEMIEWYIESTDLLDLNGTKYDPSNFNKVPENLREDISYFSYYVYEIEKIDDYPFEKFVKGINNHRLIPLFSIFNPSSSMIKSKEEFRNYLLLYLASNNTILPEDVIVASSELFDYGLRNSPYTEVKDYLQIKISNTDNEISVNILEYMANQLDASYELWTKSSVVNDANPTPVALDCQEWQYLNDIISGVLEVPFGGIGSVILGSAFSWGTYKECK